MALISADLFDAINKLGLRIAVEMEVYPIPYTDDEKRAYWQAHPYLRGLFDAYRLMAREATKEDGDSRCRK